MVMNKYKTRYLMLMSSIQYRVSSIQHLVFCIFISIFIIGCGEKTPFEPQDSTPPTDEPGTLLATHFPTADGCWWEYVSADGRHSYTAKITGTRNIGGFATRILETDSDIPVDYIGSAYGFPVRRSLFTKDLNAYTEHAFELWVDFINDFYFQRYLPKRIVWSFPLYVGKEWTVSKLHTIPQLIYTRKVISLIDVFTVPAGDFTDVFCVEEYISTDVQTDREVISKYWLAADVGVIEYEYIDFMSSTFRTYELRNWVSLRSLGYAFRPSAIASSSFSK